MDFLRKLYPSAFKLEKKVVKPFVIQLIIFVVVGFVVSTICGVATGLTAQIEVVGLIVSLISGVITFVVDLYCTGGIVCSVLKFVGVIKDAAPAEASEAPAEEVKEEAADTTDAE